MAETISELYFRLGLDASDFKSGLVDANQTLSQNLRNLNNQNNLIQLKTQVDLSGLEDSEEQLKVKQEAVNQQLAIQQDRINLTTAAYQEMVQAQGENSQAAYNLAMQLEKERLAMAKLEAQSQALSEQKNFALGINWDMLSAVEPVLKITDTLAQGRESVSLLGRAITIPQIKIASAALLGLSSIIWGTIEATNELSENNSMQAFAEDTQNASNLARNSFGTIINSASDANDAIEKYFRSTRYQAIQTLQEKDSTILDAARDIFRVAYLLDDNSSNFSDAIAKVNAQSQYMKTEIGNWAVVVAGTVQILETLANSATAFVNPSIKRFEELKLRANELNISLNKTQDLQSLLNLSGADYNDIRDYVRGVQDAVITGDSEDREVIALEKYGVAVQDANGKLLQFNEALENLYQGYLKARDAGEAESYVIMTNGQAAQDVLPFFERLAKAKEDYAKIEWATSDFDALQKTSNSLKLQKIQMEEYENSIRTLGLPLADHFAQNKFEIYQRLTKLVEDNRDTVLEWEFVVIEALKRVENVIDGILDSITEKSESVWETLGKKLATSLTGNSLYANLNINSLREDFSLDKFDEEGRYFYTDDKFWEIFPEKYRDKAKGINLYEEYGLDKFNAPLLHVDDNFLDVFPEQYRNKIKLLDLWPKESPSIFEDAKKDLDEYIEANAKAREETEKTAEEITAGLSYSYNRIAKYKEELANIEIDLKFGDDDYAKSIAKLDVWYDKAMKDAKYYPEEQSEIDELYNAKAELIEMNRLEKVAEIREQYANSDKTQLEKQLSDFESEMEKWIKIGMDADEALEISEQRKNQAIQKLEEEFAASTNNVRQTALEQRLAEIDKEKQAWIQKGIDEVKATQTAEEQKSQAIKRLNSEWKDHVNSIYQTALENRLAEIDKEKQAWIQKGIDEVKATKDAEQQKVDARRNAAMEIIKSQLEEFQIYQQGGYKALKAYKLDDLIKTTGVDPELLNTLTPQAVEDFQKAQQVAERSLLPNFMTEQDRLNNSALLQDWQNKQISELERILGGITVNGETPNIDLSAGLNEGLTVFSTNIDTASSSLSNLSQPIADVVEKLNDFSGIIFELSNSTPTTNNQSSEYQYSKVPTTVNVNVTIDEAHAWDTEHIQELADKVADHIAPEIVSAIGGDSNGY